ncbi:MAG: M42 family metallopeptidase [Caldilineaceae bacterium SB0664_bin_27]|uniref:M42 family metallopeptidase n=1 Tax=Caldilineaceae bacterium SB0664_bin_27 TaxID=2605260 RepID=A0A6B0YQX2_9CHLR|nr:M42 family metallopeptidase [Caldilineaceae bacterium SB0664_bin_27]
MRALIEELCGVFGPSGQEERVREAIINQLDGLVDEIRTDRLGNLIAVKRPTAGEVTSRRIMLASHMDEIGIMVTHVDAQGFCRFTTIGGVVTNSLIGSRVHFANGVEGAFGLEGSPIARDRPTPQKLFLDVGADSREDARVQVGDSAVFRSSFGAVGDRLFSPNLDDRIGCAVLIQTLRELESSPHEILAVFTAQEEVGARGATTAGYGLEPEVILAIDVTATGDFPKATPMDVALGKGPAIKVMDRRMISHPKVRGWLESTAQEHDIPYQLEVLEFGSTDASAVQVSRSGVPAGAISIPCRYVHTPSQVADYNDACGAVRLLVNALSGEYPQ